METIEVETTILDGKAQLDHILYTPKTISVMNTGVEKFLSDHYAVIAELEVIS